MLGSLKRLLGANSRRGPRPSSICLWQGIDELRLLAEELTANAISEAETLPTTDGGECGVSPRTQASGV